MDLELKDIEEARKRLAGYVRRTPIMAAPPLKSGLANDWNLYLKLENLQITGSFKARGAVNKLLSLGPEAVAASPGLITASGGNHGLGVAYAGWLSHKPVTVYVAESTPEAKVHKLEEWGATVIKHGRSWNESNQAALQQAEKEGLTYIHPFADPAVIAGQGTLALEILEDAPDLDMILVAIGGGGLISGIALGATSIKPSINVTGVEPVGAPTLYESVKAGKLVELSAVNTIAGTLASRKSEEINLEIIRQHTREIVLVTDDEMKQAQEWLWFELGIASEPAAAAAMAALLTEKVRPGPQQNVCVVICAANADIQFKID
ncbi:MAG TPA: threonine/serine dehydratase [Chloroflexia bacterium]|nr:threonine/serine dehydratase [Chloroflexia bacterium]